MLIIIIINNNNKYWHNLDLKEKGVYMRNWIDWAQDRDYWRALMNAALNLQVS